MGLLDGILGQLGGNIDLAAMAGKLGIDPALAEQALTALGQSHPEPGDTIQGAAAKTGLDAATLGQIVEQLGGEGMLAQLSEKLQANPQAANVFSALDADGDGLSLGDLAGAAKGLFGKR
jgi:hypothetical protein